MTGVDVSGKVIVLDDLQAEMAAAGIAVSSGLTMAGPGEESPSMATFSTAPKQAPGTLLFTYDDNGEPAELPTGAQAVVDAHVPMRDVTDAEYAAEFQDAATSATRKQEIRDITAGLLPREKVPMT